MLGDLAVGECAADLQRRDQHLTAVMVEHWRRDDADVMPLT
jgi:hypothetical protein